MDELFFGNDRSKPRLPTAWDLDIRNLIAPLTRANKPIAIATEPTIASQKRGLICESTAVGLTVGELSLLAGD